MSKKIFLFVFLFCIAATGYVLHKNSRRPNILIISVCSLRWDLLTPFNPAHKSLTPNISEFANKSFVFENSLSSMSWSNVVGFLSQIPTKSYIDNKYNAIGNDWSQYPLSQKSVNSDTPNLLLVSARHQKNKKSKGSFMRDNILDEVALRINDTKNWPFILVYHTKFMHIPYLSPDRPKDWEKQALEHGFLIEDLAESLPENRRLHIKSLIDKFLSNPKKYFDNFFLFLLLGDRSKIDSKIINSLPFNFDKTWVESLLKSDNPVLISLINNPETLNHWRNSKNYFRDLSIIKEVYSARLKDFDKKIGFLLNQHSKNFLDNTVIIFTGDHGEAFGEHGLMGHGEGVFDEMHRFPLMIKFPGMDKQIVIKEQFYQGSIASIVNEIINNRLNKSNFLKFLKRNPDDAIFTRNCTGNLFSVRYKNEWKLHIDARSGRNKLFHLPTDPNELKDVIHIHPNKAAELEEMWLLSLDNKTKSEPLLNCK